MPKINNTHRLERLRERIKQIENDVEVDIRDINNLLTKEQQQLLKDLWTDEQANRKDKSYKKEQWQSKKDIRLRVLRDVVQQLDDNLLEEIKKLQREREVKAAKVFMDAFVDAKKNNQNALSKANIALQRAGFKPIDRAVHSISKRDKEVRDLEEQLLKQFEAEMTEEEREQRELLKETERAEERARKGSFK